MKTIMNPSNETKEQELLNFYDNLLELRTKLGLLESRVTDTRNYFEEDMPHSVVAKIKEDIDACELIDYIYDTLPILQEKLDAFDKFTHKWSFDAYCEALEHTPKGYHIENVRRAKHGYKSAMCFVKSEEK